jgi:4-hydroxy-tetrahydrodipicolinate synthase
MEFTKSEAKQWAKEHYKGLEDALNPSFSPDLQELDEEGIRYDVQHAIKQGFKAVLCTVEMTRMTFDERKRFVKIALDEAKGKIHVSVAILQDTIEQDIEMLHYLEKIGCSIVMIGHPVQFYPRSAEELFRAYKYICDSTNMAVVFYPARIKVKEFHPSYFPVSLLPRIADIPNVVGMKVSCLGVNEYDFVAQSFHLLGDKILVNYPPPDSWMITVPNYGQQWAGAGPYSMYQNPDNPLLVRYWDALQAGELDKAFEIYWQFAPITEVAGVMFAQTSYEHTGLINALMNKYTQWCNGGNGGTMRMPIGRLFDYQKEAIRAALRKAGLTPREPEEEFYVGRVNYAKGARLKKY